MKANRYLILVRCGGSLTALNEVDLTAEGLSLRAQTANALLYAVLPVADLISRGSPGSRQVSVSWSAEGPGTNVAPVGPNGDTPISDPIGAFVRLEEQAGHTSVTRGPSGMMPCLFSRHGDVVAFASDFALLVRHGLARLEIDRDMLADQLLFYGNTGRRTALSDVFELLPGEIATVKPDAVDIREAWSPWDSFARPIMGKEDASAAVFDAADSIFMGLRPVADNVLVTVSGGLDSSIVGALASKHFPHCTFVTFYTADPVGDERRYARELAQFCGRRLVEIDIGALHVDAMQAAGLHLPRPTARAVGGPMSQILAEVALETGASIILNGFGGDNVFCYLQSSTPLLDRMFTGARWNDLEETARDIEMLVQCSTPSLLRHAAKTTMRHLRTGRRYRWASSREFLSKRRTWWPVPVGLHPWFQVSRQALPGQWAHAAAIIRTQPFLERFDRRQNIVDISPLLGGAMLDACLRIPSWLWCSGGRNRSIARMAFAPLLPSLIINRKTKGSPVAFYARSYETNRISLIDKLCSGYLAEEGIVDTDEIKNYLRQDSIGARELFLRILDLADVESWCRGIVQLRRSLVAAPPTVRRAGQ